MYTNIKLAIANLVEAIDAATDSLLEKANQYKTDYVNALRNLSDTNAQMQGLFEAIDELQDISEPMSKLSRASDNITEIVADGEVFTSNIEDFESFCAECGKELCYFDEYEVSDGNEIVCEDCVNKNENEN